MRSTVSKRKSFAIALAAAAAMASAAAAAPAERSSQPGDTEVAVAGVQVAIDPQTGRLRQPTPEESRRLLRGLEALWATRHAASDAGLATKAADGTLSLVLGGEALNIAIARLDGSGVANACVENADQAAQFLNAPALEEQ